MINKQFLTKIGGNNEFYVLAKTTSLEIMTRALLPQKVFKFLMIIS